MRDRWRLAPNLLALAVPLSAVACAPGVPEPAPLGLQEACAACRMAVSDPRLAAQIVAPGELPLYFDDLGCLGGFVRAGRVPEGGVVFVADHRTKAWVRGDRALYSRVPGLATPMGSHLVAHETVASRDADAAARGSVLVEGTEVFGGSGPPVEGRGAATDAGTGRGEPRP